MAGGQGDLDGKIVRIAHMGAVDEYDVLTGLSDKSAFANFERMERKVMEIEAQADAAVELEVQSLDDQFKALEAGSGVDDELAALKAKMSLTA